MPPKQAKAKVNKIVEDKTFGLKNKNKSKKVQDYITTVEKSAKNTVGMNMEDDRAKFKAKKDAEKRQAEEDFLMGGGAQYNKMKKQAEKEARDKKKKEDEAAALAAAAPVEEVDPKTILCEKWMKGICMDGDNCKYSHDDSKARKSAKLSLYQDAREKQPGGFVFTTAKTCPHFLDAVEHSKFGHFWVCPNGGDKCVYRHHLPFGYVIKREIKREGGDDFEELDISEQIEIERARLDISKCTPITEKIFFEWVATRKKQLDAEIEQARTETNKNKKGTQTLSGRSLFQLDPSMFKDDAGAVSDTDLTVATVSADEEELLEDIQDAGIEAEMAAMTLDEIDVEVDASLFE